MINKKTKFVVVGFGYIGKRHFAILNGNPASEVVAIVDNNERVVHAEDYPKDIPWFNSINEFVQSNIRADVVTIATPNGSHCSIAIESLESGFNVVIEKPMGLNKSECERVVFTSLQKGKQVFVVKQNRFSPPSTWMKDVVSNKIIGETLMVQINCYWNRDDRYYKKGGWKGTLNEDGGTLFTQFSHFIDLMYWVFGDVVDINSQFADFNHEHSTDFEDSGFVNFKFVNGGMGCINFSTAVWDKNLESSITVIGSNGSFKVGGQYMNEVEYCNIKDYQMPLLPPTNPPNDYGQFKGSAANHHYVFENVINTLNGTDTINANSLEGLKVVDIIERIYKSRPSFKKRFSTSINFE